jgi:CDP-diacylglycerol---glycerol-3-phosphate 3-phosphatidyltransferase
MMSPNLITLVRVFLALASVGLFHASSNLGPVASLVALLMLVVTIALDGIDGYIARRTGKTSEAGAIFDIAADRIVESVFWIYFSSAGLISFWIPVIVIARGGFTDFLRAIASTRGEMAFGEKTMMQTSWGKLLVGSRASRAAYGAVKCAAFFSLGLWLHFANAPQWQGMLITGHQNLMSGVRVGAIVLAISTVAFCLVRGVPVIVEGLRFFREGVARP